MWLGSDFGLDAIFSFLIAHGGSTPPTSTQSEQKIGVSYDRRSGIRCISYAAKTLF